MWASKLIFYMYTPFILSSTFFFLPPLSFFFLSTPSQDPFTYCPLSNRAHQQQYTLQNVSTHAGFLLGQKVLPRGSGDRFLRVLSALPEDHSSLHLET